MARNVVELAEQDVAYVTVGHLFNRGLAEVANAIPFLPDHCGVWCSSSQPGPCSLLAGRDPALAKGLLIDVSHLTEHAIDATLSLLEIPSGASRSSPPAPATASAARSTCCPRGTSRRSAAAAGVIGLILAEHQATEGIPSAHMRRLAESVEVLATSIASTS